MMFTKTQLKIMEIFVSDITGRFSIKQISELIKKPYPLVHRSAKELQSKKLIIKDEHNLLYLNYKENGQKLAYVESLRAEEFLGKNKTIALFVKDVLDRMKADFFTMLIFGSAVKKSQPRDIDVMLILPDSEKADAAENMLYNISSNFSVKFDCNVINAESAREMLSRRDEPNVVNETLGNHIIAFGAENYYRVIKNAR